MPKLAFASATASTASLLKSMAVACFCLFDDTPEAKNGDNVGVTKSGTRTSTIQPIKSRNKMPNPSLGRKEPDVMQANRVAGISGSNCFHLCKICNN